MIRSKAHFLKEFPYQKLNKWMYYYYLQNNAFFLNKFLFLNNYSHIFIFMLNLKVE